MPAPPCTICGTSRSHVVRPKNQQKVCKDCFIRAFESEIHDTIVRYELFKPGERIAIGASGGKDSTVLASVLKTLNERYKYGLDLVLLSVDEGIKGYRDDSLDTVRRNAAQYDLPLEIIGYDSLYGWTMDQVVSQIGKKGNCTYCGVFRRQALDRGAAKLDIKHVVTGHNADDIAETVMMNLLRADLPRLARATSIVTESSASEIKRSKPLKYAYEKEIVLYAHHKKLDYFTTECIYSPEAFRGSARTLIKGLEKIRPCAILDIVKSGEDMAQLVPNEISSGGKCSKDTLAVNGEAEEDVSGCGSAAGRSNGDELADMEAQISTHENREATIIKVTSSVGSKHRRNGEKSPEVQSKKVPGQRIGKCVQCGYLSSQSICKACMLLEGLNKNRPRLRIGVEI